MNCPACDLRLPAMSFRASAVRAVCCWVATKLSMPCDISFMVTRICSKALTCWRIECSIDSDDVADTSAEAQYLRENRMQLVGELVSLADALGPLLRHH